jgi:hypothetical protein
MLKRLRNLMGGIGYKLDKCIDVARYIFPSRYSGNKTLNTAFDSEFKIITNGKFINDDEIDNLFVELNVEDTFVDDTQIDKIKRNQDFQYKFNEDNINEDYHVKEAVKLLMIYGDKLDHEERFIIAVVLHNLYGENGKEMLLGIKNSEGTIRCWNSAKMKRYAEITTGSLFFVAKKYGFEFLSNTDIIKKDIQEKYKPIKDLLISQKKTQKENEKRVLEIKLEDLISDFTKEEKEIKQTYDRKISELFASDDFTDSEKELQQKLYASDKKNKIQNLTEKYASEKKVFDKKLQSIEKEIESDIIDVEKDINKEIETEFKKKEKEYKKQQNEEQSRKKIELSMNGITDLKRYVGEKYSHHWEQASQLHKDCKIFLAPDGKHSKLIKFSDRGEFGSVMLLKGLEWSGIVETSYKYTYKIISGFYNATGEAITDVDFSKMDFSTTNRIINNEFDKYDNFYLKGEVKLQITPNLEIKNTNGVEFEQLFRYTFGDFSDFLLKYLCMIVFEDRKEARPVVAFNGVRGTGKSLYMGLFKYLYGDSSKEFNEGEFNSYASAKIVTVDEKYSNRKELWDTIKRTTGNKTVTVRPLYSNPIECDSISYYIVASNDRPIKITEAPESSKDNQIYAVTLTTPFSDNYMANQYYRKHKQEGDKDVLSFLTNRIGAWLQSKGYEIFNEIISERNGKDILRYGIRVPITKTLLDWCESGYPDEFKKPLLITASLMQNKNSILTKAIKMGFLSKKFYEDANVDTLLIVEFFRKLRDKALLETIPKKFMINGEEKTGFKIRNVFQLLLWLKPFLEEDDVIEELLESTVTSLDRIHYEINNTINHTPVIQQPIIPQNTIKNEIVNNIDSNPKIDTPLIEKVKLENNITEVENVVLNTEIKQSYNIDSITNRDVKYLFTTEFKNSMFNTKILSSDETDDNIMESLFEVSPKNVTFEEIDDETYNRIIRDNTMTVLKNSEKKDVENILPFNEKMLSMMNKSINDDSKLVTILNVFNRMEDVYKESLTENEYKKNESEFLFYTRKAIEELNENKNKFGEWKKVNTVYDFYKLYKGFNSYLTFERIKHTCNYLSILLSELNINITTASSEYLFLLFYRILAH